MARRGNTLERYINDYLAVLPQIHIHGHKNNPLRTMQGVTLQGEPFDYEIFMPDCIHLFDAKECADKNYKWHISGFYDESTRLFKQLHAMYCAKYVHSPKQHSFIKAYFLVWFSEARDNLFIMFDVFTVNNAIIDGKKYLTPIDGEIWTLGNEIEELAQKGKVK